MKVDFSRNEVKVTLKPKFLNLLPDLTRDYRIVNRLKRKAEKLITK